MNFVDPLGLSAMSFIMGHGWSGPEADAFDVALGESLIGQYNQKKENAEVLGLVTLDMIQPVTDEIPVVRNTFWLDKQDREVIDAFHELVAERLLKKPVEVSLGLKLDDSLVKRGNKKLSIAGYWGIEGSVSTDLLGTYFNLTGRGGSNIGNPYGQLQGGYRVSRKWEIFDMNKGFIFEDKGTTFKSVRAVKGAIPKKGKSITLVDERNLITDAQRKVFIYARSFGKEGKDPALRLKVSLSDEFLLEMLGMFK